MDGVEIKPSKWQKNYKGEIVTVLLPSKIILGQ